MSTKTIPIEGPLQGKVIAITGGASGIGLATAKLLASRGAIVCIADINPAALSIAKEYFVSNCLPHTIHTLNVIERVQVDEWINDIVKEHGALHGAVNAAGTIGSLHGVSPLTDLADEEWDKIISVNLTGAMYCLRAELRKVSDGGSIVNVASIQGVMGFAGSAAYVASKHGLIGLTRATAKEVGNRSIRVNAIAPGSIQTPLLDLAIKIAPGADLTPTPIKRLGTAEEMAAIIGFLIGNESSYVTGAVYAGDGGWAC